MEFIPKHYLLSDSSFWEPLFIEWNYTNSILLTAYDLLRNDKLIYLLHSSSVTLRELMEENGFPKETKIFADSGIFMLEWFKFVKAKTFKKDYSQINLPPEEVLEAYKLIDPDYLVAPDEIILPKDNEENIKKKIAIMKENVIKTLDLFPANKVVGVIQGIEKEIIEEIYDFEKEQGITSFARGGLIPIKRRASLYCNVLKHSRKITRDFNLHAFGVTNLQQIKCYNRCAGIDSFDSTIIRGVTSELYWLDSELRKKRFNDKIIENCSCMFCNNLEGSNSLNYDYASRTILENLYLHNIITVNSYSNSRKHFRNLSTSNIK